MLMRLFVACEVPAEIRQTLSTAVRMFPSACADVKWVEEENMHITVKFLGEVPDKDLPSIREALGKVPFYSLVCRISGFGAFPDESRPRVIWAGLEPGKVIEELHENVESALSGLGIPKDRDFSAHLTIGRVRQVNDPSLLRYFFDDVKALANEQTFRISALHLKKSVLAPSGPVYSDAATFRASV
jgi:RNA 2',3'-cyclic 3'-phosphodiesterase